MAIPFGLGLLWMTLIGVQTKLLVKTKSGVILFSWVMGTSMIWGYLIRVVVLDSKAIIPYAIGTAIGSLIARKLIDLWKM